MARPVAVLMKGLIGLYKLTLSPALAALGVRCRHAPTCSTYAIDAIDRHGSWVGGWMALARLARCRPLGSHGIDPAPDTVPDGARWWTPWRYGDWRGPRDDVDDADEGRDDAEAHLS